MYLLKISKHIKNFPALILLIATGLGIAQMHEAVHSVESISSQIASEKSQIPPIQQNEECMICVLTVSATETAVSLSSVELSFLEKNELQTTFYSGSTESLHIYLRAPPAT